MTWFQHLDDGALAPTPPASTQPASTPRSGRSAGERRSPGKPHRHPIDRRYRGLTYSANDNRRASADHITSG